jgi:NitT/TauT family transport system ATP-binding protein
MLPHARVGGMSGLLEIVHELGGREDLPELAERLRLEVDDLLPTVDAAVMLGFAKVEHGDVQITPEGTEFATAGVDRSKQLFAEHMLKNVPFVNTVVETLRQKKNGKVDKEFFIDILDEHFTEAEAERQFQTLIYWGRYAQLFEYDADEEKLYRVADEPSIAPVA